MTEMRGPQAGAVVTKASAAAGKTTAVAPQAAEAAEAVAMVAAAKGAKSIMMIAGCRATSSTEKH